MEKWRLFGRVIPLGVVIPYRGLIGVGSVALSLFYAAVILRMLRIPRASRVLRRLAPFGRMALTNYILESVFMTTIGYGYGLGRMGKIGPPAALLLTFLFLAVQVPVSAWWLRRFRFGPAEWLWRCMTYGTIPPFRLPADARGVGRA